MDGLKNYLQHVGMFSRNIWLFMIAALLMGTGRQVFQVLRNQYLMDLGFTAHEMTSVQGFMSAGTLVIAVPAVAIVGRMRAKSLLVVVAVVNALCYFAQAWFGDLDAFRSAALTAGMAMGMNVALTAPFLMRNTGMAERIFAFSIQASVSWPLSGFLGSALSGELQSRAGRYAQGGITILSETMGGEVFGYRFALCVSALLVLAAIIPIAFIKEGKPEGQERSVRELLRVHNKGRLFLLSFSDMIIGFGAGLTVPFFNVYFQAQWNLNPAQVSQVFMVMFVVLVATYLMAPPLIRRFGAVKVIIASQILSLPFFVELALGNFLWLAVVAFVMRQALMNLSEPIYRQFAQEAADKRDRNAVAVAVHTSRQISFTVANFVSGYLIAYDNGRFTIVIFCTIALYVLAIAIELLIYPKLDRVRRFQLIREHRSGKLEPAIAPEA